MRTNPKSRVPNPVRQGWEGWDDYAPFYDWENARTLGRRDVAFWQRAAKDAKGRVLELGCGTGRISLPLARAGIRVVGIDRSEPMLGRAAHRRSVRTAAQARHEHRYHRNAKHCERRERNGPAPPVHPL